VSVSAIAKTTPQGSRLPPFTFPVRSFGDRNDYPVALVKLRGLLARSVAGHSVAAYAAGGPSVYTVFRVASGDGTCKDDPQCTGRQYTARSAIISQELQDQRAIFIANHWGLNAIGFNAQDAASPKTRFREHFVRVRALLDIYLFRAKPSFLGDRLARIQPTDLKITLPISPSSSSRSHCW
jgi:hypothetical protein